MTDVLTAERAHLARARADDRRGGDDRGAGRDPHHGRVVAVVQADEQLARAFRSRVTGQPGDHRLQLAGRDLAGAAAAVGVLRQPLRACHRHLRTLARPMACRAQG